MLTPAAECLLSQALAARLISAPEIAAIRAMLSEGMVAQVNAALSEMAARLDA